MTKAERLSRIEEQYELFIIKCFDNDETERLPEGASVGNYLGKNNKVAEKEKSTLEDEIKKRVKEAEARRREGA